MRTHVEYTDTSKSAAVPWPQVQVGFVSTSRDLLVSEEVAILSSPWKLVLVVGYNSFCRLIWMTFWSSLVVKDLMVLLSIIN